MMYQSKSRLGAAVNSVTGKMASRGVFVIIKQPIAYAIKNIISNVTVLSNIPTLDIVHALCDRLNEGQRVNHRRITALISTYRKHESDGLHYKHIIQTVSDATIRDSCVFRLEISEMTLHQLSERMSRA